MSVSHNRQLKANCIYKINQYVWMFSWENLNVLVDGSRGQQHMEDIMLMNGALTWSILLRISGRLSIISMVSSCVQM